MSPYESRHRDLQRHTRISSSHPFVACAFIPGPSPGPHRLIIVTTAAMRVSPPLSLPVSTSHSCFSYSASLTKPAAQPGTFFDINTACFFDINIGPAMPLPAVPGLTDCLPMLFVAQGDWQLAFCDGSGAAAAAVVVVMMMRIRIIIIIIITIIRTQQQQQQQN